MDEPADIARLRKIAVSGLIEIRDIRIEALLVDDDAHCILLDRVGGVGDSAKRDLQSVAKTSSIVDHSP
jgi:hypothetical protein